MHNHDSAVQVLLRWCLSRALLSFRLALIRLRGVTIDQGSAARLDVARPPVISGADM